MIAAALLLASTVMSASPADIADLFEAREYRYTGGHYRERLFRYRLFVPRSLKPGERCPLLVWLHGHGEHGSDNVKNLRWLELILEDRKHIERYRFFILATQSPDGSWYGSAVASPDDMLTVTAAIFQKTTRISRGPGSGLPVGRVQRRQRVLGNGHAAPRLVRGGRAHGFRRRRSVAGGQSCRHPRLGVP